MDWKSASGIDVHVRPLLPRRTAQQIRETGAGGNLFRPIQKLTLDSGSGHQWRHGSRLRAGITDGGRGLATAPGR